MQITFQMIVKHFLLQHNSFTVAFLMIKTLLMKTLDQVLYPHLLIQTIRVPFEQIDDSSEESFEERVAHGLCHVQSLEFEIRRQRLAPLIDRLV